MANAISLIQVQAGKETVWDTEVAATAMLMGLNPTECKFDPQTEHALMRWAQGNFAPAHGKVNTSKGGVLSFSGVMCFEDVVSVFNSSIHGGVTGTGAGSDKTWTWTAALAAAPTAVHSRTMEGTDGGDPYTFEGCTSNSWELSGGSSKDGIVTLKHDWQVQDWTTTAITAALTTRAVTVLPGLMMDIYIDTGVSGTMGATAKTGCLIDWSVKWSAIDHRQRAAAALTPTSVRYNVPEIVVSYTLENNAAGKAEVAAQKAGTQRLVELRGVGAAIPTGTFNTLKLQTAGLYDNPPALWGNDNNDTTVSLSLRPMLDSGSFANFFKAIVINSIAAEVW